MVIARQGNYCRDLRIRWHLTIEMNGKNTFIYEGVIMTNLRNIVNMAFEEGSRSPYDLKPLIIDKLLKTNDIVPSAQLNLKTMAAMVRRNLPNDVIVYLRSSPSVWLSGGSILKSIVDPKNTTAQWKTSDYDLFCSPIVFAQLTNNMPLTKGLKYQFNTARIDNINFIVSDKFTSWEKVVEDFDIHIAKFVYQEKLSSKNVFEPIIYANEKTKQDFIYNIISLSSGNKIKSMLELRNRIKKYVKRGFRDTTGIVIKNNIQDLYVENYEQT